MTPFTGQEAAEPPIREAIVRSMGLIRADCAADAQESEGQPFSGRVVGAHLGGIYAMIDTIAHAVEVLAGGSAATEVEA